MSCCPSQGLARSSLKSGFTIPTAFSPAPHVTGHIPSRDNPAKGEGDASDSFLEPGHGSHLPAGQKFMVQKVSTQLFSFVDSIVLRRAAPLTDSAPFCPNLPSIFHGHGPSKGPSHQAGLRPVRAQKKRLVDCHRAVQPSSRQGFFSSLLSRHDPPHLKIGGLKHTHTCGQTFQMAPTQSPLPAWHGPWSF